MNRVEILAIKPLTKPGNLKAFVSIRVGELIVHDLRVVQQSGQAAWVSPPQREYTDQQGQRKFYPVVEFAGKLKEGITQAVLSAWTTEQAPSTTTAAVTDNAF